METPLLALTRRGLRWSRGEPTRDADTRNMRQLVQLRWLAVAGQLGTVLAVAYGLGFPLPVAPMLGVVAVAALVNLLSVPLLRARRVRRLELVLALLFDVGLLSAQLYFSGGATNPFASLYLVQVVLGAILLGRVTTWVIVGVTCLSYGLLASHHRPLTYPAHLSAHQGEFALAASWLSFALVAALLVMFVTRIIRNLRTRDARLADLRQQASEEDHLVRMGLFASGAAHELGTPLATLAVILGDWQRIPKLARDPELHGEIADMRAQVARCKEIVTDVLHSVAELPGSVPERVDARAFLSGVVADWQALHPQAMLDYRAHLSSRLVIAADPALRQAIWNVLDNAAEMSPEAVGLTATTEDDHLTLCVSDAGPGFAPAVLTDFGKPQRSRKGAGHGVGLFLVAGVLRRLGGSAVAANRDAGGAAVTLRLPLGEIEVTEVPGG